MARLLHTWVTAQARQRPEAIAVVLGGERVTYWELDRRSTLLAWRLRRSGCRAGDRVALLAPRSPEAVVALLAVLKAGGVYVPIDLASPPRRVATMLEAVEPRCLLAIAPSGSMLREVADAVPGLSDVPVGWLGAGDPPAGRFTELDDAAAPDRPADVDISPGDAAYILFTSGSTGVPKGVVVTHASVAHFVEWAVRYFGLAGDDRVSGHSPVHFDLSVFDMFGAFAAGAELHLVPSELSLLPHRLADWIRDAGLTQWFSVPSVLGYLAQFNAVRPGDFPALRRVIWCGDVLPTPVLRYWMRRLPAARFTNLYGPTEAAIASSYYTVPACPVDDAAAIPIGRACDGEELLVLDEELRPVSPGVVGDLYIRGVGLSPGYWKDPERTAAAFVYPHGRSGLADRMYRTGDLARVGDDGLVYFVGRADAQVKSRGHRIELGEVETALHALPGLADGAIVAVPTGGFDGVAICCAYVPGREGDAGPVALRRFLAARLPAYMLPSRWLRLDRLPVNANGKVDRVTLRELFRREAAPS
jgi:amino acid adenylation domain-containing protein